MMLKDKVAIITGAASGIGYAAAEKFGAEGAIVAVCDIQADKVQTAVAQLLAKGVVAHGYVVDVANRQKVDDMVADLHTRYARIDILVNNAGITQDASLLKMTEAQFDSVLSVNVKGVFNCTQAVVGIMVANKAGAIVNTSSISGLMGNIGQTNYAASKAAILGLTKTWARELGAKGIRVNTVVPGAVQTDILHTVPEHLLAKIEASCWQKRIGTVEEIANVYAFLASDNASYINGATLEVSGGVSL
ncbi:3-oxoacyl-ACP reductase FabG [Marinomonas sp. IMCC 4694]|uniref:3-oxoacyl-ACP reductase FabG n=1 Tax=Marinomonas sp. IMCC 4694 TaxID=2605432 RepID=UPI0011E6F724|nr:3-oxoacyl-ACP reductase FabG [Marinomonas sp. IMCC 4694]TYL46670.1 glucose 1-dehydrogenase [Marinomonas sp. IMCC 4694]